MHAPRRVALPLPVILAALVATAGCVAKDDTNADVIETAADGAVDGRRAPSEPETEDAKPAESNPPEQDPTSAPAPDAPTEDVNGSAAPQRRIVTHVHEREGQIEPFTYVGAHSIIGTEDAFLPVPVPQNAVAIRVQLHWNGSDDLDLGVADDRQVCSGAVGIVTCQLELATQAETEGWHWRKGESAPATLEFDEAAVSAGCPEDDCKWQAIAYAKGAIDVTFHLIVEVDTLEEDGTPAKA